MHLEGVVSLGTEDLFLPRVLFDTGALSSSYVSLQWVEDNKDAIGHLLLPSRSHVALADNVTVVPIDHIIDLPLSFVDYESTEHTATLRCCVLSMPETSLIVGLPHILFEFFLLFESMLRNAHSNVVSESHVAPLCARSTPDHRREHSTDSVHAFDSSPIDPWSKPPDPDSIEESSSYVPCSFPGPLLFLLAGYDKSLEIFNDLLMSDHIDAGMRGECGKVLDLLRRYSDVFVPPEWLGITGVPPLKLMFREGFPMIHKPPARPINPKLLENCEKEFTRMKGYFYRTSSSSRASCLVTAFKPTPPGVRFCGDYRWLNEYIVVGHYPIPNVQNTLNKAKGFRVFCDLDWTNSFHQILLDDETADNLSVQTPWGQYAPKFLPEGVGPASGVLQSIVVELFSEFSDWTIAIFDNLLILAHDYEDAYAKLEIILRRCQERRVVLKMAKSYIGVEVVTFFGYRLTYGKYELSESRKAGIMVIPMPNSLKKMQRFLGSALFFKSFIPDYSEHCALLTEMTKKGFDWDPITWTRDYAEIFERFKGILIESTAIYFPDYTLEWILRTDASEFAVGAVLVQVVSLPDQTTLHQPLAFASHKFTEQALKWDVHKKEAFSCAFGIRTFDYLLRGKSFILETDHRNLLWIESNTSNIVVRWRAYMQCYDFLLRHIPGTRNLVADWMSRMYSLCSAGFSVGSIGIPQSHSLSLLLDCMLDVSVDDAPCSLSQVNSSPHSSPPVVFDRTTSGVHALLSQVHGGRNLHFGALRTWNVLNATFPGHRIPYRVVQEFVSECIVCQKFRLGIANDLVPVRRTLKQPYLRKRVGIDRVAVTPADDEGNNNIIVVVAHWSKHVALFPAKDYEARSTVTALFCYFVTYGTFDEILTDPGSDFMSAVVKELNGWLNIRHKVSLVDVHESNGVERTNLEILRHLIALTFDDPILKGKVKHCWGSDPSVCALVSFALNDEIHSETGIRPFDAMFGSEDGRRFILPEDLPESASAFEQLQRLDEILKIVRRISSSWQDERSAQAQIGQPTELTQNTFQTGDFVLLRHDPSKPKAFKLLPPWKGPYQVIEQLKNDVEAKHMTQRTVHKLPVDRLKLFSGTEDEARDVARADYDQHVVQDILAYRGDPELRTSMIFEVLFADGEVHWLPWSKDLSDTEQFEVFCNSNSPLFLLLFTAAVASKMRKELNGRAITVVSPGDTVYVDIRFFGNPAYYLALALPDSDHITYVVIGTYRAWYTTKQRKISIEFPLFNELFPAEDHYFVRCYGSRREFDPARMVLVDLPFARLHPQVLPEEHRNRILAAPP